MLRDWWRIFRVAPVKIFKKITENLRKFVRKISHKRQIEVNNRQIYWSIWWHLMCFINILTFREFYELNVTWPHVRCIELRLLRHFKTTNSLFIKSHFLTDRIEFGWMIWNLLKSHYCKVVFTLVLWPKTLRASSTWTVSSWLPRTQCTCCGWFPNTQS